MDVLANSGNQWNFHAYKKANDCAEQEGQDLGRDLQYLHQSTTEANRFIKLVNRSYCLRQTVG